MPGRPAVPRVRFSISCLDSEWERIREVARRRGVSMNDHLVSAGLSVELDPAAPDTPSLALSEGEQRLLFDRVGRLEESMAAGSSGGSIARLRLSLRLLLMTTLRDLVRQGRETELGPLLTEVFGVEAAPAVEREFREWMASEPPLLG